MKPPGAGLFFLGRFFMANRFVEILFVIDLLRFSVSYRFVEILLLLESVYAIYVFLGIPSLHLG